MELFMRVVACMATLLVTYFLLPDDLKWLNMVLAIPVGVFWGMIGR